MGLEDVREKLEAYKTLSRGEYDSDEDYSEARAEAWQEFLEALAEQEFELE